MRTRLPSKAPLARDFLARFLESAPNVRWSIQLLTSRLHMSVGFLFLVIVMGGCGSLSIAISDTNPPVFRFSAGPFAECCEHLAVLTVWEVKPSESTSAGQGKVIWQIWPLSGTDNSAKGLPRITYGQVPPGFVQKIPNVGPPPTLEEGRVYEVAGPRFEVPEAYVRFRIENGKPVLDPTGN